MNSRKAESQWPEALDLMIGAFRSGLNTESALNLFYESAPEPLRSQIHRRAGGAWRWMPVERKVSVLFHGPGLTLVRSALVLSLDQGGRQGFVLETAARLLRSQREYEERVRGLTAHARATAWIVALSPLFMGVTVGMLAPEFLEPLVSTSQGLWLLLSAASLIAVGLWSVQKMSRIQI